jgi:hypothetical protein
MSADRPRIDVPGHNYRSLFDYGFQDSRVVGSNTKETQKEVKLLRLIAITISK